jgi:hypothetical protein
MSPQFMVRLPINFDWHLLTLPLSHRTAVDRCICRFTIRRAPWSGQRLTCDADAIFISNVFLRPPGNKVVFLYHFWHWSFVEQLDAEN